MFVCETLNSNSNYNEFYPNILFSGSQKNNPLLKDFINYIQINISTDFTAQTQFLGNYNNWILLNIQNGYINLINGYEIGVKTIDEKPILLDDLMSNNFLDLYKGSYGLLIPSKQLENRISYGWFIRSSPRQILESDTILGNYFLLSIAPEDKQGILEPLSLQPNWVGFWKIPSDAPYWGLKPNFLGDNLDKITYPSN